MNVFKVLIVDDEHHVVEELSEYVKSLGFDVISTTLPEDVHGMLMNDPTINIVIIDLKMPKLDGFVLIEQIKKTIPNSDELNIIIVSGNYDIKDALQAVHLGVSEFLTKPLSTDLLHHSLKRIVEILHLRQLEKEFVIRLEASVLVANIAQEAANKANEKLAFQIQEKDKRAYELTIANEEKLKQADELTLAASVFTHAREGIIITDAKAFIIEVNNTFTEITGYSRQEVVGKHSRILQSKKQSPEFYIKMWQAVETSDFWTGDVWDSRKNGETYAQSLTISVVKDVNGKVCNYVALFSDITALKDHQKQLEWMANHDVLTKLPNRVLLGDRLSQALIKSQRQNSLLALVFLDLDGFKTVNDNHGHNVGDELLIIVAQRMKEALRDGDTLARIGGDEFVAVLADLNKDEDCQPMLERLLLAASEPMTLGEIVLQVTASIGVALYPQNGADADVLMRHADQAMYLAKKAGKNQYHLFDSESDNSTNN